jgi:hypothetical protein
MLCFSLTCLMQGILAASSHVLTGGRDILPPRIISAGDGRLHCAAPADHPAEIGCHKLPELLGATAYCIAVGVPGGH